MVSDHRCQALQRRIFNTLGNDFEVGEAANNVGSPPRCVVDITNRELHADYPHAPLHYGGAFEVGDDFTNAQVPYPDTWDWERFISRLGVPGCQIFDHVPALEVEGEYDEEGVPEIETPTMFLVAGCEGDRADELLSALRRWRG